MKYLSLFSGIGGFELGIQQAYEQICGVEKPREGFQGVGDKERPSGKRPDICADRLTCIGFSEIDKYATKIYQSHFHEHKNYGDITKINAEELPDFDLLVGGFPCQSFSIAGKRGGFNDTRGTLFFEIARILKAKQPRLLLLENVKGLLSHDKGRTFATIISTLDELGYDLQWQVLNSKNFGVPQNRERVFIVGHLRETSRPEVFPIGESNEQTYSDIKIAGSTNNSGRGERARVFDTAGGVSSLTATDYKQPKQILQLKERELDGQQTAKSSGNMSELSQRDTPFHVRRLTPVEAARLQGFPDDWHKIEGISDTQAYKCYGNAVTVNVIREIIKRLVIHLPQK